MCSCPECGGEVNLIPARESEHREHVNEVYPTSYPSAVAACSRCEWACAIVETQHSGIVIREMGRHEQSREDEARS